MNTIVDKTKTNERVMVVNLRPEIDGGRFPIKRVVGERVRVEATVIVDGHDLLQCLLLVRFDAIPEFKEIPMRLGDNDLWTAEFEVETIGQMSYTVEGWIDRFGTWQRDFKKRLATSQDLRIELQMAAVLVSQASERASGQETRMLSRYAGLLANRALPLEERTNLAISADLLHLMNMHPDRSQSTRYEKELVVIVDRPRARFGAWYEMFPRSCSPDANVHGTFKMCGQTLPSIAAMGFDVVYLPPIHPIGSTNQKGTIGSPWAIGSEVGGHMAIHPALGTLDDFRHFMTAAEHCQLEVALDLAFQCSPDHPYVREHPEWFRQRPDGSIQYAENPPKKYEDIYPLDFETAAWEPLWDELLHVVLFWIGHGIRIFRVDNPHTKPLAFWEWLINSVKNENPDIIFLSEAFTRPALMYQLAKVGFSQSYNYYPWKNTKSELESYFTELCQTDIHEYFRYSLWPNTPDILTDYLQHSGRPGFVIRLILAATLGASYGIYGPAFELCEDKAREPGSEEYLRSEKYEIKHWKTDQPGNLRALITHVNEIRRTQPALQRDDTLTFHPTTSDQLICFSKRTADRSHIVLAVVNLDPHNVQSGEITLPLREFDIEEASPFRVRDLLTGIGYLWEGARPRIELDPNLTPAHLFVIER